MTTTQTRTREDELAAEAVRLYRGEVDQEEPEASAPESLPGETPEDRAVAEIINAGRVAQGLEPRPVEAAPTPEPIPVRSSTPEVPPVPPAARVEPRAPDRCDVCGEEDWGPGLVIVGTAGLRCPACASK